MLLTFEDLIKRPLVWMTLDGKEILKSMGNSMASAYLLVKQKLNLSLVKYSIRGTIWLVTSLMSVLKLYLMGKPTFNEQGST